MTTSPSNIPEAAVEAAAEADYGNGDQYGTWETEPAEVREMYLKDARRTLEAAAPHIRAQVLEEAAGRVMGPSDVLVDAATCRWIAMELRESAVSERGAK